MAEPKPARTERIYVVTPVKQIKADAKQRLIRASTPAQAIRFATKDLYLIEVCDTATAFKLATEGITIETAGEES